MPHINESNDDYDDEDWYDEDDSDEADDAKTAPCPECSAPLYDFNDKCPACGYYLTAADRRQLWSKESKPAWITITALIVLIILVLGLFGIGAHIF